MVSFFGFKSRESSISEMIKEKYQQEKALEKNVFRYRQIYIGQVKGVDMNHELTRTLIKLMVLRKKRIAELDGKIKLECTG